MGKNGGCTIDTWQTMGKCIYLFKHTPFYAQSAKKNVYPWDDWEWNELL
jgi:hypothetical protein